MKNTIFEQVLRKTTFKIIIKGVKTKECKNIMLYTKLKLFFFLNGESLKFTINIHIYLLLTFGENYSGNVQI